MISWLVFSGLSISFCKLAFSKKRKYNIPRAKSYIDNYRINSFRKVRRSAVRNSKKLLPGKLTCPLFRDVEKGTCGRFRGAVCILIKRLLSCSNNTGPAYFAKLGKYLHLGQKLPWHVSAHKHSFHMQEMYSGVKTISQFLYFKQLKYLKNISKQ